ncbi:MAG: Gfo/Idh/MocA family oxidoreductase [Bacillota bacterium]|nr:Gfo/Idh/MocA family oxidoreductase [Bacillota bacterium]
MPNNFINWGVISCAGIADIAVLPGIKSANNAKLHAVSSRSMAKAIEFKEKFGAVKAYDSYEAVLDDPEVEAVYIPLPNSMHLEWVLKAAAKKKHILCEKPLGCTAQEVLDMQAACEKNGVLLMEAFAYRQSPVTKKVKELVDNGAVGTIKMIEAHFYYPVSDLKNVRLQKDLLGGAVYDVGCYNLNVMRYIAGEEPTSIYASGEIGKESGVDENSTTVMNFRNNVRGVSHCGFNVAFRSEYQVIGDAATLQVPDMFNAKGDLRILIRKNGITEVLKVDTPDNYMLEVEQFGRCILNNEKPLLSLEDSYKNAQVIDEILKQLNY